MKHFVLVAGEASGDLLGASLIRELKLRYPNAVFSGIAGPQMIKEGCSTFFPMEKLSLMGLVEILKHLPELLKLRKRLFQHIVSLHPCVFIGIDAPDFNLSLEKKLKKTGIKTVHYVSPSIWAWRQWRVKKIKKSVDLMLTLFPFEVDFYQQHHVNAAFVGHPLADMIPIEPDFQQARAELELEPDKIYIALLPGSRLSEIERLGELFIQTAVACYQQDKRLCFIVPFANGGTRNLFEEILDKQSVNLPVQLTNGNARLVMQACDMVLLASGTAALEAMLLKKPMVVAYKLSALTYWILTKLKILKVSLYSLPNCLAGKPLVEEYMQNDATVEHLQKAIMRLINSEDGNHLLHEQYRTIHTSLRKDASVQAVNEIIKLIQDKA